MIAWPTAYSHTCWVISFHKLKCATSPLQMQNNAIWNR